MSERKVWLDKLISQMDMVNATLTEHGAGTEEYTILIYNQHDKSDEETGVVRYGIYELAEDVNAVIKEEALEDDNDIYIATSKLSFDYRGYEIVSYVIERRK